MGELFIYKCKTCGQKFEMYHLVQEPVHEIVCPECGGKEASRIVSHEHKGALPGMKTPEECECEEEGEE